MQLNKYYKSNSKKLLAINRSMFIFVDPGLFDFVREERRKLNLLDKTIIVPFDLKKTPYYRLKPFINKCFDDGRSAYLVTKTIYHRILVPLTWTKIKALQTAVNYDLFKSKKYAWVDFGLFKINTKFYKLTQKVHQTSDFEKIINGFSMDKVTMGMMFDVHMKEISDRKNYYLNSRFKGIGGFFSVPTKIFPIFYKLWCEELKNNLNTGYPAFEEQIFGAMKAMKPSMFDIFYCDYMDIIENFSNYRTSYYVTFGNLKHCRIFKMWDSIIILGKKILESTMKNYKTEDLLHIYNEILIGTWWGNRRDLSLKAALKMVDIVNNSDVDIDKNTSDLFSGNLKFHNLYL